MMHCLSPVLIYETMRFVLEEHVKGDSPGQNAGRLGEETRY